LFEKAALQRLFLLGKYLKRTGHSVNKPNKKAARTCALTAFLLHLQRTLQNGEPRFESTARAKGLKN